MPIEATPENLLKLQTELTMVRAQDTDLTYQIRQRKLVEVVRLERALVALAHRVRDQILTAPGRHAALLAAPHAIDPAKLAAALDDFVHYTLTRIADAADADNR